MDTTNKKGANISFTDAVDIHSVQTSVSSAVIVDNVNTDVNFAPSHKCGGTSVSSSGISVLNSNLTISPSNNELRQTGLRKPPISTSAITNMTVFGGSNHVELPSGDGVLVAARQVTVPKVAVDSRPSVAVVYNLQGLFDDVKCNSVITCTETRSLSFALMRIKGVMLLASF